MMIERILKSFLITRVKMNETFSSQPIFFQCLYFLLLTFEITWDMLNTCSSNNLKKKSTIIYIQDFFIEKIELKICNPFLFMSGHNL